MQTLEDRKCDNYLNIIAMLGELEQAATYTLTSGGMVVAKGRMTDKLYMYDSFERILNELVKDAPDLFQFTKTGWSITMIAPEAKNESDPTKDILKLNVIGDILWAKDIVLRAFLSLFPKEG